MTKEISRAFAPIRADRPMPPAGALKLGAHDYAIFDHGFASHAAVWLVQAPGAELTRKGK